MQPFFIYESFYFWFKLYDFSSVIPEVQGYIVIFIHISNYSCKNEIGFNHQLFTMKGLIQVLFLFTILAFVSCGDDDCTQDDWVGTYTGTADCNGTDLACTVTITASGADAIIIRYEIDSSTTTFDPLTISGCSIERTITDGGVTGSVSVSLNGDKFELEESLMGGGFDNICKVTATRMN